MRLPKHLAAIPVLFAIIGAGCAPTGDRPSEDYVGQEELVSFRAEVSEALAGIESQLSQLQDRIQPEVQDSWSNITSNTQAATAEMRADLDRLSTATAEEAREIQRAAAERLAELEADMTRTEISSAVTSDSLVAMASSQLNALESDIRTMAEAAMPASGEAIPVGAAESAHSEAIDLQARLSEIRSNLAVVPTDTAPEAFVTAREELGSEIAALTQDVRQRYYERQWGVEG